MKRKKLIYAKSAGQKTKFKVGKFTKVLDKEFSLLIRSKGYCEKCGIEDNLQCCHIIPRTNKTLRWDILNAISMCMRCHIWWSHKNPLDFTDWFKRKFPGRYDYLMENRNKIVKRTEEDYNEILENILSRNIRGLIVFPIDNENTNRYTDN